MTTVTAGGTWPMILYTRPIFEMSDELFFNFHQTNRNWRIGRNAKGEILIMPPLESTER